MSARNSLRIPEKPILFNMMRMVICVSREQMQIPMSLTTLPERHSGTLLTVLSALVAKPIIRCAALLAVTLCVASCGGGGGTASAGTSSGGSTSGGNTPSSGSTITSGITYTPGVFLPYSTFAAQCAAPRSGTDPVTGKPWPDRQGSLAAENHWLRAWTHDLYLWFDEVPDRDPGLSSSTAAYFDLQKTSAVLASGQAKDRFHFTYSTAEWQSLSQSGVSAGYGIDWDIVADRPPRRIVVPYVEPESPAGYVHVGRGAEVVFVDGVDAVNDNTTAGIAKINAGLFPSRVGELHSITLRPRGATGTTTYTWAAANVTRNPVPIVRSLDTPAGRVGYLLFNDHIATAEKALVDAVTQLKAAAVQDLVLDIRYNGGGFLDIANELAYMIAGPVRTAGRVFERIQFNSRYPSTDPVTGRALAPDPFFSTTQGFGQLPSGQALPSLGLSRVYVLTSPGTCSASESILNALRGIGVEVVQIGGTTCGKPYGFYPADNCGTTYFSIQFRGVNDLGFGEYAEGFSATRTTGAAQANLPGCGVADDFTHDLGDTAEAQFAAALAYRSGAACPAVTAGAEAAALPGGLSLQPPPAPWRRNRILR